MSIRVKLRECVIWHSCLSPFLATLEEAPWSVSSRLRQTNIYLQSLTAGQKSEAFV